MEHNKAKKAERKKITKTFITIDKRYRHLIAGQQKIDKSMYSYKKHKTEFLSYYPYENCIWNSICIFEYKTNDKINFTMQEVYKLIKSKNEFFRVILMKEMNKDFDEYYQYFNIEQKLNHSFNLELKVRIINKFIFAIILESFTSN